MPSYQIIEGALISGQSINVRPKPLFWFRSDTETTFQRKNCGVFFPTIKGTLKPADKFRRFSSFVSESFEFGTKSSDTDTIIGPWFWFPIPKPGFGRTLDQSQKH